MALQLCGLEACMGLSEKIARGLRLWNVDGS